MFRARISRCKKPEIVDNNTAVHYLHIVETYYGHGADHAPDYHSADRPERRDGDRR